MAQIVQERELGQEKLAKENCMKQELMPHTWVPCQQITNCFILKIMTGRCVDRKMPELHIVGSFVFFLPTKWSMTSFPFHRVLSKQVDEFPQFFIFCWPLTFGPSADKRKRRSRWLFFYLLSVCWRVCVSWSFWFKATHLCVRGHIGYLQPRRIEDNKKNYAGSWGPPGVNPNLSSQPFCHSSQI